MRITKLGLICLCLVIFMGCSSETIRNKPIFQKALAVETLINQSEWKKANQEANIIRELYKDNEWKFQLLGDEAEYNQLEEQIKQLQVSLEEKDKKEAKMNLAMIEHYLESLYFN